jgi:hypothetical protein
MSSCSAIVSSIQSDHQTYASQKRENEVPNDFIAELHNNRPTDEYI